MFQRKENVLVSPKENTTLTNLTVDEVNKYIKDLDKYYLKLRNSLSLDRDVTFGVELEFQKALYNNIKDSLAKLNNDKVLDFSVLNQPLNRQYGLKWSIDTDDSVSLTHHNQIYGGEIISPILFDNYANWQELKTICEMLQTAKVDITPFTSAHVHINGSVLDNDKGKIINLLKLWMAYEDVIFRFSYGEDLTHRDNMHEFARPMGKDFIGRLQQLEDMSNNPEADLKNFIISMETNKKFSLNLSNIRHSDSEEKNTIEVRCPNGTIKPEILQNNVNFFTKLFIYAGSSNFSKEKIDNNLVLMRDNIFNIDDNDLHLSKAMELADMIFDNNEDKAYFIKQYIKVNTKEKIDIIKPKSKIKRFI